MSVRTSNHATSRNRGRMRALNDQLTVIYTKRSNTPPTVGGLFFCECDESGCGESVEISPVEYWNIRVSRTRCVLAPGHEPTSASDQGEYSRRVDAPSPRGERPANAASADFAWAHRRKT